MGMSYEKARVLQAYIAGDKTALASVGLYLENDTDSFLLALAAAGYNVDAGDDDGEVDNGEAEP